MYTIIYHFMAACFTR